MIEPGAEAPGFRLRDQDGTEVSLGDLRGRRVMLAFYPMDFSPVCSDQLSIYQEVLGEIEALETTLLAISADSSYTHQAFANTLHTEITLLSDFHPKGEVTRAYGAYISERGHPNRSLVLVDEQVVRWVHESPTPLEIPGASKRPRSPALHAAAEAASCQREDASGRSSIRSMPIRATRTTPTCGGERLRSGSISTASNAIAARRRSPCG